MTTFKFRSSFSMRTRSGKRNKYLNKRTLNTLTTTQPPLLVIDIDYIETIISKRKSAKQSKLSSASSQDVCKLVFSWINKAITTVLPNNVIYVAKEISEFNNTLPINIIYANIVDYIYSAKIDNIIKQPIVLLSNNINLWLLSSNKAELSFLAIDTNNRLLYYNNKTGLDVLSKLIGTFKIINKLNLDTLKYLNLQYLFLLLFYISLTNKSENEFYFDGKYFASLNSTVPFLKSNGYGLKLITDAHKFLSYAFLTKPEFLDYFLIGSHQHYNLQLPRLTKLMSMDNTILSKWKQTYDINFKPSHIPVSSINTITKVPCLSIYYYKLWTQDFKGSDYFDYKAYAKIVRAYIRKYPDYIDITLFSNFPASLQKDFVRRSTVLTTSTDTIKDDVADYVSNLIAGVF